MSPARSLYALHDDLLRRLCGDAAEVLGGDLDVENLPDLDLFVELAGLGHTHLDVRVIDLFDHFLAGVDSGTGLVPVDLHVDLADGAKVLAVG
jgi:hypothetical protein